MTNKNISKNFFAALVSSAMMASMVLSGVSFAPIIAHADNGLHLGVTAHGDLNVLGSKSEVNAKVGANKERHDQDDSDSLNVQDGMFLSGVKAAQTTFKASVKDANQEYKDARKVAGAKLQASIKTSANQVDRTTALKTYFSDLLAAFKVKAASIQAAFQAFIDAKFNQAPVANPQNVTVAQNTSVAIALTGSDPEHSPLTYVVVANTAHGTLTGTAPNLTYTPNANFTGNDSFTFKVNDGSVNSTLTSVSITVH